MKSKILLFALAVLATTGWAMPPLPGVHLPAGAVEQRLRLGIDVTQDPVRDAGKKGIVKSERAGFVTLVSGTKKFPVVLIRYPDEDSAYPKYDFQQMLFGSWPSGTAHDYYHEVSYNQLDLTGTVYGWFKTDSNKVYYGYAQNDPTRLILEAAKKSDSAINFANYDNDGDGYVDCFTVVHAGKGMEETGDGADIWSHMWTLSATNHVYTTNDPDPHHPGQFIKINLYTCDPERSAYSNHGTMACIGVFCHEWGHALGLPDLYDTDGGGAGLGLWCLMAAGSWGGDYRSPWCPVHLCAWSKISLGWITPTVVTGIRTNEIKAVENIAQAYQLAPGGTPQQEYFLIENRQKIKFDQNLQGSGLLIYHIDQNIIDARGGSNQINAGGGLPYGVALVQADGRDDMMGGIDVGDGGDPFPGSTHNTAFDSAFTNPAATFNGGAYMTCGVNSITPSAASMSALMYTGSGKSNRFKFANHDIGDCVLTVTENSALGFTSSTESEGAGFKYPRYGQNWLYYASLACGDSINYVVDNYSSPGGRDDQDFLVSTKPDGRLQVINPPRRSDQDILALYDDRGHPGHKGLAVKQLSMAYKNPPFNDFVIVEYAFKNNSSLPLNGLYIGEFADFDMGNSSKNSAGVDSAGRIAYCWQVANTNPQAGIKLLSPAAAANVSAFNNGIYIHPLGGLPDSLKFKFLNGTIRSDTVSNSDVSVMVSAGPFDLAPKDSAGDTVTVAFAFVGAPNLAQLEENGDSAQAIYFRRNSVVEPKPSVPVITCALKPPSPNPSRNRVAITYLVSGANDQVGLELYDLAGRVVRNFSRALAPKPGVNHIVWDGRDDANTPVPAGVYFLRLRFGSFTSIEKLIRLR